MATRQATVDFIIEQAAAAGTVTARKMFGEYALYVHGRVVALICDDHLYVKPTAVGRAFAGPLPECPPYKGAKPHFKIDPDRIDEADWLAELLRQTAQALPAPVPKRPRTPKRKSAPRSVKAAETSKE